MDFDIVLLIILLAALILTALATVLTRTLPTATIMLALTSVLLAIFLFVSGMRLAAVIELSVSAGLVTAILASAIAMLKPTGDTSNEDGGDNDGTTERAQKKSKRLMRYLPLPIILLVLAAAVLYFAGSVDLGLLGDMSPDGSTQTVLWDNRTLDVMGLILLILAGVLGVAALIRRREEK